MKGKIGAIAIVAMLFLGMLAIFPVYAVDRVYIVPASKNLTGQTIGYQFYVLVYAEIADPPALFTWQVKVTYPAFIEAIAAGYCNPTANATAPHDSSKSQMFHGKPTVPVSPIIDPVANTVLHGESLMGADQASGNKALMYIIFQIVNSPGKLEEWIGTISCDNVDTFLLDPNLNNVSIQKQGCSLTYNWVQPTVIPKMGWQQSDYLFYKEKNWTCTTFDKEVQIKNLDAGWDLTAASFIVNLELDTWETYVSHSLKPNWAGTAIWDGMTNTIDVDVTWTGMTPPSGNVPVLDIVLHIESYPTQPPLWSDTNIDTITDVYFADHIGEVPHATSDICEQVIEGFMLLEPAGLEAGDVSVGPGPAVCQTVAVPIKVTHLDAGWNLIGVQFRINYDITIVEPICATEGPYLPGYVNDGELGTFFIVFHEPDDFGPHTIIGDMILPDEYGVWHAPFPGGVGGPTGSGIVAYLNLHIIKDRWPDGLVMPLHLFDILLIGLDADQNIIEVLVDEDLVKDGSLTIWHDLPGRVIDVYGGMECTPFPAPYGGQGANKPMDMVYPQKLVCLHVDVTYNYWPVQMKDVGFEIEGPYWHGTDIKKPVQRPFLLKLTNRTDANGHTWVAFRMPWYCDDPDSMLGQYKVTVTVDIACVVVMDTLVFDYDYVQRLWKVVVTPPECGNGFFNHCDEVEITVTFGTYAQQKYPDLLVVVIYDELGVPIGIAMVEMEIGGATFCSYKNYTAKVKIHIPKWAFVGWAKIHVMCFNKDPTEGGIPWCPEYTPYPEIFIGPY